MPRFEITARSRLDAPADRVWERISTMEGVNDELRPLPRMSRGFFERARLASQRLWEHERRIEPAGEACVVVDRVCHEPRLPFGERVQSALIRQVFLHRHRRLRRRFGGGPDR